ncbi:MAG: hypothetical protein SFX73_40950 [Kofleriaceae bacterium]|nr:hypothetical protein [Kofleriaceae bacterium]
MLSALATAGACGSKVPEADPAKATARAKAMAENPPAPAGVPTCTGAELKDGLKLSWRSLLLLAKDTLRDVPERAEWSNPVALDAPAVRTLLDDTADETARRRAAAAFLGAPALVVYRIDMVDIPIALMVKELKRGFVGVRAIRYVKGEPTCIKVFNVQNDKAKSEWAMDQSNKAAIDPKIAEALREDYQVQLFATIAALEAAP